MILIISGSLFWFYIYSNQNKHDNTAKVVKSDTNKTIEKHLKTGDLIAELDLEVKKSKETKKDEKEDIESTKDESESSLPKTSEPEKKKEETENIYPNMLKIPSANIEVKTVVGGFTQKDVDTNDITYVEDWSKFMNCDLYFGHNTNSLATLPSTKIGDIITAVKPNGSVEHYKVTLSRDGILEESSSERGELWLDGVHYNKGFIKDRNTKEILFAYSDDGYDNNNLAIITCYKEYSENGRWVVFAERVSDELSEQQDLSDSRISFKNDYLMKNLYSVKDKITFTKHNNTFDKSDLGITIEVDGKKRDIRIADILNIPVYNLGSVYIPSDDEDVMISDSNGNVEKFRIESIQWGKRKFGKYDEKSGFLQTYIIRKNRMIFSFNGELNETCNSIIIVKKGEKEYVIRLIKC